MKYLIAYNNEDEDKCQGDSTFQPSHCGEYTDGMTFEKAVAQFEIHMKTLWYPDANAEDAAMYFEEEFGSEVTGFWVVEETIYKIITNIDVDWGGDSASYAGCRTMKSQLDNAAEFELTDSD